MKLITQIAPSLLLDFCLASSSLSPERSLSPSGRESSGDGCSSAESLEFALSDCILLLASPAVVELVVGATFVVGAFVSDGSTLLVCCGDLSVDRLGRMLVTLYDRTDLP